MNMYRKVLSRFPFWKVFGALRRPGEAGGLFYQPSSGSLPLTRTSRFNGILQLTGTGESRRSV